MRRIGLFTVLGMLFLLSEGLYGQNALQRKVSISTSNSSIEDILFQIEDDYQIYFTYSRNSIPVDRRIQLNATNAALSYVLDKIFYGTAVAYREKSGRILLKIDRDKAQLLALVAMQEKRRQEEERKKKEAKRKREVLISNRKKEQERLTTNPINSKRSRPLSPQENNTKLDVDWSNLQLSIEEVPAEEADPIVDSVKVEALPPLPQMQKSRLAQISVMPFMGTNRDESNEISNNLSVNVFWGINGGLDGLEVGGFFNHLTNKGVGLQIAGLGNSVRNRFIGTQVAGIYNVTGKAFDGIQAAGIFNVAKNVNAVQVAGLFNIAAQRFSGIQAAGFFNVAKADGPTVQVAGFMNASKGTASTQISGVFNFARDIDGGQITSLLNVARRVDGFQIGLINVADTVSGLPIGILNFIQNGYNRVEISANETFFGNFALRIGVRRFYNILYIGGRYDRIPDNINGAETEEIVTSWGIGYGIGTGITFGSRFMINLEAMAIHVNEQESWTDELNLLNQYKLAFDIRTGRRTSIFFGPTLNLMFSKLKDENSNLTGSNIMPYTFYDEIQGDTNLKMWAGLSAGIRI